MPKPYSTFRDLVNTKPSKPSPWKSFPSTWDTGGQSYLANPQYSGTNIYPNDSHDSHRVNYGNGSYAAAAAPVSKNNFEDFPHVSNKVDGNWNGNSAPKQNYDTVGPWWESKLWTITPRETNPEIEDGWNTADVHSEFNSWSTLNEKVMRWNDSGALEAYLKSVHCAQYQLYESAGVDAGDAFKASEDGINPALSSPEGEKQGIFTKEVVWSPKGNERNKATLLPDSAEAMLSGWKEPPPAPRRRRKRNNQVNPIHQFPPVIHNSSTRPETKVGESLVSNSNQSSLHAKQNSFNQSILPIPTVVSSALNNYVDANRDASYNYNSTSNNVVGINPDGTVNQVGPAPLPTSTSFDIRPVLNLSNKDYKYQPVLKPLTARPWATTAPFAPSPEWFPKPSSGPLLRKTSNQKPAKVDVNPCVLQSSHSTNFQASVTLSTTQSCANNGPEVFLKKDAVPFQNDKSANPVKEPEPNIFAGTTNNVQRQPTLAWRPKELGNTKT